MKLGRFAILMIGIMVFVATVSWGFFYCYIPNKKETAMLNDNKALQDAEAAKMPQAKKRFERAEKMIDDKAKIWKRYEDTRTPPMSLAQGGIDLSVNPYQLAVDTPKFRDSIQAAVNKQLKMGGVKVISAPTVQQIDANLPVNQVLSSFYNYPSLRFPVVIFDFGTITVQGTYKQILDNVRAYKNMPNYLAVTDGLRIDGTSPNLTGTYNLSIVGYIRSKLIAPEVSEGGGEAGTSMGGGGLAGFGGGGGGRLGVGGPPNMGRPGGGAGMPGRPGGAAGGARGGNGD